MKRYFKKMVIGGIGLGLGFILVIGAFYIVRAVAPGTITNPAFGPLDDDVNITVGIPCDWTDWYDPRGKSDTGVWERLYFVDGFCDNGVITQMRGYGWWSN